jgi:integrase/recombinase XerC
MLGRVSWALDVDGLDAMAYRDTRGPGLEVLTTLFAAVAARKDPKGKRDLAILRLLFDLGLRRGEIVELDVCRLSEQGISILGKGRLERETLTLPKVTRWALESWLAVYPAAGPFGAVRGPMFDDKPLFVSLDPGRHERLTGHGIYMILRTWSAMIGKIIRPHGIRHTAITKVLDETNGNTRIAQGFSRHRRADTLAHYDDARKDGRGEVAERISNLIP